MKSLANYIDKYNEYCWDVGMKPEEVPTPGVFVSKWSSGKTGSIRRFTFCCKLL